jgi:hypothetical protein
MHEKYLLIIAVSVPVNDPEGCCKGPQVRISRDGQTQSAASKVKMRCRINARRLLRVVHATTEEPGLAISALSALFLLPLRHTTESVN